MKCFLIGGCVGDDPRHPRRLQRPLGGERLDGRGNKNCGEQNLAHGRKQDALRSTKSDVLCFLPEDKAQGFPHCELLRMDFIGLVKE